MSSIQSLFSQAQTLSLVLNKEVAEIDQIRCGEHPDGSRPMNFSTHMRGFGAPQSHGYLPQNPEQIDLIYRKSEIVKSNMAELTSIISRLKVLAAHEGPRKEIWLSKIESLEQSLQGVAREVETFRRQDATSKQQVDYRRQLFGDEAKSHSRIDPDAQDFFLREGEKLTSAHSTLDETLNVASNTLDSLHRQRNTLKGIQRRMLDLGTSLGLSANVIRLIERREGWNALITYSLMVITVLIVVGFYYYMKR